MIMEMIIVIMYTTHINHCSRTNNAILLGKDKGI